MTLEYRYGLAKHYAPAIVGNASSTLNEVKPRLAVDDARIGSPAHEHREAIEVLDEMSHCHWIENEWRGRSALIALERSFVPLTSQSPSRRGRIEGALHECLEIVGCFGDRQLGRVNDR
jgi:hypothetical protein